MSAQGRNLLRVGLAVVFLVGAVLACGPTPGAEAIAVVITSPTSGSTVAVGQEVLIDSTTTAEAGVAWVELAVNGEVVRRDLPPEGNPTTFRVSQAWTPSAEGLVRVSIVACDVAGNVSQAAVVTLQVVASGAAVPTAVGATAVLGGPTALPTGPTEEPPPPVTTEAGCTLDSQYVADVTIPDGTVMTPGVGFVKTWRVRNSGTCDWEAGFQLIFVSGAQMGGPASVALPAVPAGGQTEVSVNLAAPSAYGTHEGTWRMRAGDGTMFGTNLTVVIVVPAPVTDTPLPTGVPTVVVPTGAPVPTPEPTTAVPYTEMATWHATVGGGGTMSIGATCPTGSIVVGGGFMSSADVVFVEQYKDGNGWTVMATNTAGSGREVYAYAVCLHNAVGASTTQVHSQVTMPGSGLKQALVPCPAGSIATGGGWKAQDKNVRVYQSVRSSNGWYIEARNESASAKSLTVYAVCLSGTGATATEAGQGVSVPGNSLGKAFVTCPMGTVLTGGGFGAGSGGELVVHGSSGPWGTNKEWRAYATNTSSSAQMFQGRAVCLSLPVP
jgi:hypothetical protein